MSQSSDSVNPFDPFSTWRQARDAYLDAWSKAMIDLVNTEAYAESTGRMLDSYLTLSTPARKIMEQTMTQVLAQLNMPTRSDIISLAERLTNIEMRLDDLDAKLDQAPTPPAEPPAPQQQPKPAPAARRASAQTKKE